MAIAAIAPAHPNPSMRAVRSGPCVAVRMARMKTAAIKPKKIKNPTNSQLGRQLKIIVVGEAEIEIDQRCLVFEECRSVRAQSRAEHRVSTQKVQRIAPDGYAVLRRKQGHSRVP